MKNHRKKSANQNCGRHCRAVMDASKRQQLLIEEIIMKLDNLTPELLEIKNQLAKVSTEITGKVSDLEASLSNSDIAIPAEAVQLLTDIKAIVKGMDDMTPDAPAPEPVPVPEQPDDPAPEQPADPASEQPADPAPAETAVN